MVYTLEEIRERILPIALKYHIPAVYVFGSYARGTATEDSDIDLLVDTAGTKLTSMFALGGLYNDLEAALGKTIDLVTVRSLQQPTKMPSQLDFRENVLRERVPLYHAA
jgi:predicted nucleotidyltransferase